jgi:hypothetical protein
VTKPFDLKGKRECVSVREKEKERERGKERERERNIRERKGRDLYGMPFCMLRLIFHVYTIVITNLNLK